MIHNSWISIRDDFVMGNTDPEVGPISDNAEILLGQSHDWAVVGSRYKRERTGGRDWDLWSLYYPTKVELDNAVAQLKRDNPGRTKELGQWDWDGNQTENQFPQLVRYMPDVWNGDDPPTYSPATAPYDVNLLAGQSVRTFT